jgi:hypothetical protein
MNLIEKVSVIFISVLISMISGNTSIVSAQIPQNGVYAELLGTGILATVNYERYFPITKNSHLGANIGLGFPEKNYPDNPYIPLTLTYSLGSGKNFLETGIGMTYRTDLAAKAHLVLGYKRMSQNGLLLKFRITPIMGTTNDRFVFLPWLGIALGYSF